MEQLRIYTLADKEVAEHYFKEHWSKHTLSPAEIDIVTSLFKEELYKKGEFF